MKKLLFALLPAIIARVLRARQARQRPNDPNRY
jgi:hypothetical protein